MTFANLLLRAGNSRYGIVPCRTGFRDAAATRNGRVAHVAPRCYSVVVLVTSIEMKNFREFVKDRGAQKVARQRPLRVSHLALRIATLSSAHLFPSEIFATVREYLTVEEKNTKKCSK